MYAKLNPDRKTLTPAPRSYGATCNPSAATHLAHGYKPVVDAPPETDEAHYAAPTGWRDLPDRIKREYEVRENPPPPPRRWTRLSILTALGDRNMLDAAQAFLSGFEVRPKLTGWLALLSCDYIEEGYPDVTKWNALLDGAASALGKTRAEIDAFLAAIPTEGAL